MCSTADAHSTLWAGYIPQVNEQVWRPAGVEAGGWNPSAVHLHCRSQRHTHRQPSAAFILTCMPVVLYPRLLPFPIMESIFFLHPSTWFYVSNVMHIHKKKFKAWSHPTEMLTYITFFTYKMPTFKNHKSASYHENLFWEKSWSWVKVFNKGKVID